MVESLFNNGGANNNNSNNNNAARRSTAQPRPVHKVPERGIGPISDPNENDVLCGRGGRINSHAGNVQFRDIIHSKKPEYLAPTTKKLEKAHIAAGIVNDIRSKDPPGRFLKEDAGTGMWFDIGDAKAIKKTGQALREDAPEIRPVLDVDAGSTGDEKKISGDGVGQSNVARSQAHSPINLVSPSNQSPRGQPRRGNRVDGRQQNIQPDWIEQQLTDNILTGTHSQYQSSMNYSRDNNLYSMPIQMPLQSHDEHGFQTRNIPSNQSYPVGQSPSNGMTQGQPYYVVPTSRQPGRSLHDAPFDNRLFDEPINQRMATDDITFSTISGLSDPPSSLGGSALMNMSLKSNFSLTNSVRNSLRRMGSTRGGVSSVRTTDSMGTSGFGIDRSIKSGFTGSMARSNSFSDMGSITKGGDSWKYEGQVNLEESIEGPRRNRRLSSGMSISSFLDMQSTASSTQWLQAVIPTDEKSLMSSAMMSMTSETLDALDLAF